MSFPKPDWLKVRAPGGDSYLKLKDMMRELNLATVCQSARCPNIGECWNAGTATIMLMGDVCTRGCRFCNVKTGNPKGKIDADEPQKVGRAIGQMNLDYVVLTSVDRDDLTDQGSSHFAETIRVIKSTNPKTLVEVLTPDFRGDESLVANIVAAKPDVFAHNIETVERLTPKARDPRAGYRQSLDVLKMVKKINSTMKTKSSLMLGLGEDAHEVSQTLADLRAADCDIVTFGQYLQPTPRHLPVAQYLTPEEFEKWACVARSMGFLYVASGPLVRSSYRAGEFFMKAMLKASNQIANNSAHDDPTRLQVEDWGLISFESAQKKQDELAERVRLKMAPPTLIFCTHEPIVTLGRKSTESDAGTWTGAISAVNRGGRATYHGPSQLIGYPIIDLDFIGRDIHVYLTVIENAIVAALAQFGLKSHGRKSSESSATGVWIDEKKIASIGIGVRNWVSQHGFAINVEYDSGAFAGIEPCGFSPTTMTSMEQMLGKKPNREKLMRAIESEFRSELLRQFLNLKPKEKTVEHLESV